MYWTWDRILAFIIHILLFAIVLYESRKWNWQQFDIIAGFIYILLLAGIYIGINIYKWNNRDIVLKIFAILFILFIASYNSADYIDKNDNTGYTMRDVAILTGIIAAIIIPLAIVKNKGANITFIVIYYISYYLLILNIFDQIKNSSEF